MNHPPASPPASTSSLAIISLVFGILAWCALPCFGAVVAVICGHLARSEIRHASPDAHVGGDGMALAGLILGYMQLIAGAMLVVLGIALLVFGFGIAGWQFHW